MKVQGEWPNRLILQRRFPLLDVLTDGLKSGMHARRTERKAEPKEGPAGSPATTYPCGNQLGNHKNT